MIDGLDVCLYSCDKNYHCDVFISGNIFHLNGLNSTQNCIRWTSLNISMILIHYYH